MQTPPTLPTESGKSGLSITSLVCGIASLTCLWVIAAIPAVICGHVARSKIKKDPTHFSGAGMALAGLIMGYLSIGLTVVFVPIFAAVAIPAVAQGVQIAEAAKELTAARQIQIAITQASLDGTTTGDKSLGYPADIGCRSAQQLAEMLEKKGYVSREELKKLNFENFEIGNVSEKDPGDTILIQSKTNGSGQPRVVVTKDGSSQMVRKNGPSPGMIPRRNPPFLE